MSSVIIFTLIHTTMATSDPTPSRTWRVIRCRLLQILGVIGVSGGDTPTSKGKVGTGCKKGCYGVIVDGGKAVYVSFCDIGV